MLFNFSKLFVKNSNKKRIWIVGGATGYGAAISKHYYLNGHDIIISSSNRTKLQNFTNKIKNDNFKNSIDYFKMDITNEDETINTTKKILLNKKLDILIISSALGNNASPQYPLLNGSTIDLTKFIKVNSFGSWIVTRSLFPKICQNQKKLDIIFFTSKAGWSNTLHFGFYNISKSLMHHIGINLYREIKEKHPNFRIKMAILEPGEARSEMNASSEVSAKCILPAIEYILKLNNYNNLMFIDRDKKILKFVNPL
tara:strand:- start:1291 stop:2055 length:765 start_codon:yes stop_codon:yes gene_type:complete